MIVNPRLSRARFNREVEQLLAAPDSFASTGKKLVKCEFPTLDVELMWDAAGRSVILHIEAEDYNYLPVRGWWVDELGAPVLVGAQRIPSTRGFQVNPNPYGEPKAWFCFRGWREFHDHESHQNVPWVSIRGRPEFQILGIIAQLHSDLNRDASVA